VQLPETTTTIRDYAFANCDNLRHIYIPEETTTISPNAFDNLPNTLTIHGRSGSYAESYAAENGFTFVAK